MNGTLAVRDDRPGLTVTAEVGTVVPASIEGNSANVTYSFSIPGNAFNGQTFNDMVTVTDSTQLTAETAVAIGVDAQQPQTDGPLNLVGAPGRTVSGTLNVTDNQAGMSVSAGAGTVTPQTIEETSGQVTYSLAISQSATSDQTLTDNITVTDSVGNPTTVSVTVAVDGQPPQVSAAALNLIGAPGQAVSSTLNVSDDRPGISATAQLGTVQPSANAGAAAQVSYTFTVPPSASADQTFNDMITFTDNVGNPTVVPVTIVVDNQPPQISQPPSLTGMPGQTVSATLAILDDRPGISVTAEPGMVQPSEISGTQEEVFLSFPIPQNATDGQEFTIVLQARDAAGNSTSRNVAVTAVVDPQPPERNGPLNLSGLPGATVSGTLLVRDNRPGLTVATTSGSVEPATIEGRQGEVTYTFAIPSDAPVNVNIENEIIVTDAVGNSITEMAIITVADASDPVISVGNLVLSMPPGQSITRQFTVMDDQPGIGIAVSAQEDSVPLGSVSPDFIESTSGDVVYAFVVPDTAASTERFKNVITVTDAAGNQKQIDVTISATDVNAPRTPEELVLQAVASDMAVGTFTVSDDQPGITISAENGAVDPDFIEAESGEVTYSFPIPEDVIKGQAFSDTLTITDAAGNMRTLPVKITVAGDGFADIPELDDTQRGIAEALDSACAALVNAASLTAEQRRLQMTCDSVRSGASGPVGEALSQMAPDELSSQATMAVEAADGQSRLIGSRLSALRGGATGVSVSGLSVNLFGQHMPQVVLESVLPRFGAKGDESSDYVSPFGVFVNGNVTVGDKDRSFNEPGFDFDARDITIGGDYRFTPGLIFGLALGYGTNETEFDNAGGNIDFDGIALSLYGTYYRSQNSYVDGMLSFGRNSYDTRRRLSFTGVNEDAVGDTTGTELTLSFGAGYDFNREAWTYGPYARLTYLTADIDGYRELPTASGVELSLDDQEITSVNTAIGGKTVYNISTGWGVLSPQLNAEWEHEFDNDSRLITGRFVNDPSGTRFGIPTDDPERDVFNVGVGATATLTGGKTGFIFVESLLGHDNLTQLSISGGFRFEF
ncbi:MAG: autotransporter domain-containing protein [Gammaproteobacteria bacterium]